MANRSMRMLAQFEQQNRQSAEIILADIDRHGGEQSGVVRWARLFMERIGDNAAAEVGREVGR
jgi:hypothetical protein